MKLWNAFYLLFTLYLPLVGTAQQLTLETKLTSALRETSGLLYLQGKIISHNDSGGEPALYEINGASGEITRQVVIRGASNVDWEDIASDEKYLYIGDFGNNKGTRKDLKIYRILISDYENTAGNIVDAETINFSYSDQKDFSPGEFSTNFDAEALIVYKNKLYIFTKNWGNYRSNIYSLPNQAGTQIAERVDSIDSGGLITGAVLNKNSNSILLTGYNLASPFITELRDFSELRFSDGKQIKYALVPPAGYSFQIEGVACISEFYCYVSAEQYAEAFPALYKVNLHNILNQEDYATNGLLIYPNPARGILHIDYGVYAMLKIYDVSGNLQIASTQNRIDISGLEPGLYILLIMTADGKQQHVKKLIVN